MKLEPDFELLERIGILNPFHQYTKPGGYQLEVEAEVFKSLSPFLIQYGGGEALQELFFYQLNFAPSFEPPKEGALKNLDWIRQEHEGSKKVLEIMDLYQLEKITLNFGKGLNVELPTNLVEYYGALIKTELESIIPKGTTHNEQLQELKKNEKQLTDSKLKIQNAFPAVESIIKAKSPEADITRKQVILCTYGIFYQRGHRLKLKGDETGIEPYYLDSFDHIRVYDILR